jgi:hypothetical protein
LFLFLSYACLLFLVVGLFKPWVMLWWEDTQTRKKIFQVYGLLLVIFYLTYSLLGYL